MASSVCSAPVAALVQPVSTKIHYLLTGTFNTVFLYLLAFNPVTSSLSIHSKVEGEGPHQFWALNRQRDRAYATTWASEPTLSSWEVLDGGKGIQKINTVPITATSSYIYVNDEGNRIYSAGGPTGEVHDTDENGGFDEKLQMLYYVAPHELETADKTRVALRYGSHGIDLNIPKLQAYVPHVGYNSIIMYNIEYTGKLDFITEVPSFDDEDGPRHNVPHPNGEKLYVVTEHTSYVDVYQTQKDGLDHMQRLSIIPPELDANRQSYRGDTLRLSQDAKFLYATTRGKTSATKGFITVWGVNEDGTLGEPISLDDGEESPPLERWETPTSGGKANAVEAFPFHDKGKPINKDWIVLTDDQDGWVWILEWDGKSIQEIASVQLGAGEPGEEAGVGASHAVWLS